MTSKTAATEARYEVIVSAEGPRSKTERYPASSVEDAYRKAMALSKKHGVVEVVTRIALFVDGKDVAAQSEPSCPCAHLTHEHDSGIDVCTTCGAAEEK